MNRDPRTTILCYGDSNTYGYDPRDGLRYTSDIRWPGRLQELLGSSYHIIEEGCNGRTASVTPEDEPWKDGRTCLKAILNSHKPIDLFILMLGSNDLKRQFAAPGDSAAASGAAGAPASLTASPGVPGGGTSGIPAGNTVCGIPATPPSTTPATIASGVREILTTAAAFLEEKQGFVPRGLLIAPPEIGEEIEKSPFAHSFDGQAPERSQQLPPLYQKTAADLSASGIMDCQYVNAQEVIKPSALDCLHLMPEAHIALAEAVAARLR